MYAARNYDIAWMRTDTDKNGVWDTTFYASGVQKQNYGAPVWSNDNVTVRIFNEEALNLQKDVYLLVDYIDRVPGRAQNILLSAVDPRTGIVYVLGPTAVTRRSTAASCCSSGTSTSSPAGRTSSFRTTATASSITRMTSRATRWSRTGTSRRTAPPSPRRFR